MAEIPQERDFVTWRIQNFVRRVKLFVRNYYVTWLIELANIVWRKEFFISFYAIYF